MNLAAEATEHATLHHAMPAEIPTNFMAFCRVAMTAYDGRPSQTPAAKTS
jgi:hypothetical protein